MVNNRPHGNFSPTTVQLLAARAGLGLSVEALAKEAGLGVNTVRRAEAGGMQVLTAANAERLVATLEAMGVTFLHADASGPGLRFANAPGPIAEPD
ncbi:helix-turn-helix transcriptional regulator [Brevundimonas sp.]|uniref:helix-turn-helix domain-containing protein n=1 Tax=Brevundimonas sp. TaxID=1871086 RepID=UPI001A222102|nr:helix-turn-helix transcriptional regulator [Brevundimonas sp.]MBJ7484201.1 helix-turn-helix transcriptional regulator [Brevundimonas sp.]